MHGVDSTLSLDGFEKHRHHVGVVGRGCFQGLNIVDWHADKTLYQGAKTRLHLGVARGTQGGDGATVEGFFIHHHFRPLNALVVTKLACELQSGLIGLQASGAEKYRAHARPLYQHFGQFFL